MIPKDQNTINHATKIKIMASLSIRKGKYYANYKVNGKSVQRCTGIDVKTPGVSTAAAKKLAIQAADMMERTAKGLTPARAAMEAIRQAALATGAAVAGMPSVRAFLEDYAPTAGEKTESNRRRAFKVFLEFLGERADMRLDMLTPQIMRDFLRWSLERVSCGTTGLYRTCISAALNRAVEDDILMKSPMPRNINLAKEAAAVNPDIGADKVKRLPFTPDELQTIIAHFPAPWSDMVAVSYLTGGQRLGDICRLKWAGVDFARGVISFTTQKTAHAIELPIVPPLRERLQRLADEQGGGGVYVFPEMARRYINQCGSISTEFTALLKAWGMIPPPAPGEKKGRRRNVAQKSFHSIRHSVVSFGRADARTTPDLMRAVVGHDSEEIERAYFTASLAQKEQVLNSLAAFIKPTPHIIDRTPRKYAI